MSAASSRALSAPRGIAPAARGYSERRFVLATDLDGTFLGGSDEDRLALYEWIEARRDEVGLVFVTGRDPAFLERLCTETAAPWPDFVVGDVGTTIGEIVFEGGQGRVRPIEALEGDIAARWRDGSAAVRAALDGVAGLRLQPTPFRHRVSYDYDRDAFDAAAIAAVEELGHDWLISDDRFFDVLPKGVSKGPSLRRLLGWLGVEDGRVLAAGDTLNDLSMLECGLPAVAVGGSEAAVLTRLAGAPKVHHARAIGAGGILEAIAAHGLHPDAPSPRPA
jgi:hydroxymethylpyrimidine pyrophosphatase-like HAD family hydrolase